MGYYAILAPGYTGHLNPLKVLARALERRGHRVALVSVLEARATVEKAELKFIPIAAAEFPEGEWQRMAAREGALTGLRATAIAGRAIGLLARGVLRELPAMVANERFDGLIMDQCCVGTESVCEVIGLPLAVACSAATFHTESRVPPSFFPWRFRPALSFRLRNVLGQFMANMTCLTVVRELAPFRFKHRLPPMGFHYINELRPSLVQVAQQPAFFDFPRRHLPDHFHYTAPWIDGHVDANRDFPWIELDGRPLIYASLGTIQNQMAWIYRLIVEACAGLDAQLVLSLGREGAPVPSSLSGKSIIVDYAPQVALLQRAAVALTHGGMNTTLESLSAGVPLVAIPIANDQPGNAARIVHLGLGKSVSIKKLTVPGLRQGLRDVLGTPAFRERAKQVAAELRKMDGPSAASELVERAFTCRERVRH